MLFRNYVKRYLLAYHDSIDTLPIFNFMECLDGNLQFLYKADIDKLPNKYPAKFKDIMKLLYYQLDYMDTTIFRLENKIARQTAKYILTGKSIYYVRAMNDRSKLTKIQADQLNRVSNSKKNFISNLSKISRYQNYHIDKYTISTREYFNILHDYNEHIRVERND